MPGPKKRRPGPSDRAQQGRIEYQNPRHGRRTGQSHRVFLTAGQAHDLEGTDALLPHMQAETLLADKAFDADQRVIEPLLAAGKQ